MKHSIFAGLAALLIAGLTNAATRWGLTYTRGPRLQRPTDTHR